MYKARHSVAPAQEEAQNSPVHTRNLLEFPEPGAWVLKSSAGPGEARRVQMEPAPVKAKPQGRLLVSTQLDAKDELEEVIWPGPVVQKEHGTTD